MNLATYSHATYSHGPDVRINEAHRFRGAGNSAKPCRLCPSMTAEGKDYCTDHIEEQPYVKALLAGLAERDGLIAALERGETDIRGPLALEVLEILAAGALDVSVLSKNLGCNFDSAKRLVGALALAGKVIVVADSRRVSLRRAS